MSRFKRIISLMLSVWLAAVPLLTPVMAVEAPAPSMRAGMEEQESVETEKTAVVEAEADEASEEAESSTEEAEPASDESTDPSEALEEESEDTIEQEDEEADDDTAVRNYIEEFMDAEDYIIREPGRPRFLEDGTVINDVPLFYQTDYPDVLYGDGSVATSGCTMTCIAMVATYLTGKDVRPDDLAVRFRTADGSHLQRMEAVSTIYDLQYKKSYYLYDVIEAAKQGKVSIILVEKRSPFTSSQHTLVVYGITGDGKLLIHDSLGTNYRRMDLLDGFRDGFEVDTILRGFSGAWIYEPYSEPEPCETQYPDLVLTQEDKDLLAKLIWREARGESFKGQQAVAEVILNRLASPKYSNTMRGVIYAEGQFTTAKFLNDTTADELQYKAIEKALSGPNVLPTDVMFFNRRAVNGRIWGQIGRHVFCKGY